MGIAVNTSPQITSRAIENFGGMTEGRLLMLLGRKAENVNVPARPVKGDGAGRPTDIFERPTDVAWDAAGNIFVADGLGNARIAKFDKDGKFIKSWGKKGTATGEFANVRSMGVDAHGMW